MTRGGEVGKTVSDVMSRDCECIGESDSLVDAAKRLAQLDVGAMPICGEDDRLHGMLTDRDIVVKALAKGMDPNRTKAGELGEGKPVVIDAGAPAEEALRLMKEHKVRRLPVIDENKRLRGIVSQGDLATNLDEEQVGDLVEAISAAP
jgi:CBS domain-containing protein